MTFTLRCAVTPIRSLDWTATSWPHPSQLQRKVAQPMSGPRSIPKSRAWCLSSGAVARAHAALALAASSLLASCAATSEPVLIRLQVSGSGAYLVNGQLVEQAALVAVLRAAQAPGRELLVQVVPSPGAAYGAVQSAVAAVQQVGGSVGIVGNARF
jgi:biopolymer transport protein ExbD